MCLVSLCKDQKVLLEFDDYKSFFKFVQKDCPKADTESNYISVIFLYISVCPPTTTHLFLKGQMSLTHSTCKSEKAFSAMLT